MPVPINGTVGAAQGRDPYDPGYAPDTNYLG